MRLIKLNLLFAFVALTTAINAQTVTSSADDGSDGTLRKEIADAAPGSTINFFLVNSVSLNSEITINKNLTFAAPAVGGLTIDAGTNGRAFNITGANVTITGIDFINGLAANGGGIQVSGGTLTLTDCEFTNCIAMGASGSGGAINVTTNAKLVATNCIFTNNRANRAGGAIEVATALSPGLQLTDCTFEGNKAGIAPSTPAPGNGGAVHLTGNVNASITGGIVNNNQAASEGGAFWNGTGTMIIVGTNFTNNLAAGATATEGGGALFNAGGNLNISDLSISNNQATGTNGSGGAILSDLGTLVVNNVVFNANVSKRAGGAIEFNSTAANLLTITDCSFTNNSTSPAPGNGGAIHVTGAGTSNIQGSLFTDNQASLEGGAVWNATGSMTIDDAEFNTNIASGNALNEGGGAVFNAGGTLVVLNSDFDGNKADGTSGSGGAILNDLGSLTVSNSVFNQNIASRAGGAIEENSTDSSNLVLTEVVMTGNIVNGTPGNGGAVHITGNGNSVITAGEFNQNVAPLEGGAVWNGGGEMILDSVEFSGNVASGNGATNGGGAVFNQSGNITISNNTLFEDNLADGTEGSGGALLSKAGAVTISNSQFDGNSANRAGGAIEILEGTVIISHSDLLNNDVNGTAGTPAPGNGGAINVSGAAVVTIDSTNIATNQASIAGGAIYSGIGSTLILNAVWVDQNIAGENGGGIYNNRASLTVTRSAISRNEATAFDGGGLLNNGGVVSVDHSTIAYNQSNLKGGGIMNNDSIVLNAVTIYANETVSNGGGIFTDSVIYFTNSIIAGNASTISQEVEGPMISLGYNLVGTYTDTLITFTSTDSSNASPVLDSLAMNSGFTPTCALDELSIGIDIGNPMDTSYDQRGRAPLGVRDIGAYEFTGQLSINEVTSNDMLVVYPNPASTFVNVRLNNELSGQAIMFDLTGKEVLRANVTGTSVLNVSGLKAGMYLLNVVTTEGNQTSKIQIK